jgi:uncharacterized protein YvpB
MKLRELLFERLLAPTFINDKKTLYLINDLIQKKFGLETYSGSGGMCLLSQVVMTIAATSGIPSQTIANYFQKETTGRVGHTLDDLVKFFGNIEINHAGKLHKLKLTTSKYKSVSDVIKAIKSGQPVTMITAVEHPLYNQLDDLQRDDANDRIEHKGLLIGFAKNKNAKSIDQYKNKTFHALLMVGYDSAYKMLIGRESRDSYGYKGYLRIKEEELNDSFSHFAFISVNVEDVEVTLAPKGVTTPIEEIKKIQDTLKHLSGNLSRIYELGDDPYSITADGQDYKAYCCNKSIYLIIGPKSVWTSPLIAELNKNSKKKYTTKSTLELSNELLDELKKRGLTLFTKDDINPLANVTERLAYLRDRAKLFNNETAVSDKELAKLIASERRNIPRLREKDWISSFVSDKELYPDASTRQYKTRFITVKYNVYQHGESISRNLYAKLVKDRDLFFVQVDIKPGWYQSTYKQVWLVTQELENE